jgi:hypothetical protein
MQLHFSVEQLQLLADILSEEKTKTAEDLLDRVLARDLGFDFEQLDQLSALLGARRKEVMAGLAETKNPEVSAALQREKLLLDGMRERVSEASAMV